MAKPRTSIAVSLDPLTPDERRESNEGWRLEAGLGKRMRLGYVFQRLGQLKFTVDAKPSSVDDFFGDTFPVEM